MYEQHYVPAPVESAGDTFISGDGDGDGDGGRLRMDGYCGMAIVGYVCTLFRKGCVHR